MWPHYWGQAVYDLCLTHILRFVYKSINLLLLLAFGLFLLHFCFLSFLFLFDICHFYAIKDDDDDDDDDNTVIIVIIN